MTLPIERPKFKKKQIMDTMNMLSDMFEINNVEGYLACEACIKMVIGCFLCNGACNEDVEPFVREIEKLGKKVGKSFYTRGWPND